MRVVVVCDDPENDQHEAAKLVDLDKLPNDHPFKIACEEGFNSKFTDGSHGFGGTVDQEHSITYDTDDPVLLAAFVSLPFTGTVVDSVKIYVE